jgi:5-formyltetrahydrofolate cyclo-ligase
MRGKPITRRTVLSRRDAMTTEERAAASSAIAAGVDALFATMPIGTVVALYAAKGSEVTTTGMDASARSRGLRVVYPRVIEGQRRLAFCEVTIDELVTGHFGLRQPRADIEAIELTSINVFVVPGVAFDRSGGRVGWGRGYYDATLAAAAAGALRVGVGFECQIMTDVPRDPHDAHLHHVITETNTYRGAAS